MSVIPRDRAPRRRRPRIVRSVLVLGLEAAAAFALISAISGTEAVPAAVTVPPPTADAVAAEPAEFRDGEISVSGTIRPRPERVSADDRTAFVLEGADGGRLFVVPAEDAQLPHYRAGLEVVVRGQVVVPRAGGRAARRVDSRTAVMKRARAEALVKAAEVQVTR